MIFKCGRCGEEFESMLECTIHESECINKKGTIESTINKVLFDLTEKYNLKKCVPNFSYKIFADTMGRPTQKIFLEVTYTLESGHEKSINTFEEEIISNYDSLYNMLDTNIQLNTTSKFEGELTDYSNEDSDSSLDYTRCIFYLNNIDMEAILQSLVGHKIKIERLS